eukprot:TRINITY_DN890_c0_g3_i3.p1 TRINITY_DN890_c0_g3~~TRINITY_DN890_c0_g3_i3.p1  ORF type:complete len:284 (-),score=99.06 TRINITY_DN890_c0_g3_i3:184-1035(-)
MEMRPMDGGAPMTSPQISQKVSRMGGVPTPFAMNSAGVPRFNPVAGRPEYISLQQQQAGGRGDRGNYNNQTYALPPASPAQYPATSPGRRYLSESENQQVQQQQQHQQQHVQEGAINSPQRSYYIWKDTSPYHQYQGGPSHSPADCSSPTRHTSYASQVGYFLQQQVQPTLQSGGPRTTPSGYPGGPIVPSGHLSPPPTSKSSSSSSPYANHPPSSHQQQHQQQPLSFTRALEVSDSLGGGGGGGNQFHHPQQHQHLHHPEDPSNPDNAHRDSVYDINYEISV